MEKITRVTATLYSGPEECEEVVAQALGREVEQWLRARYPEATVEVVHDTVETDEGRMPAYLVTAQVEAGGEVMDAADIGLDHDLFDAIWGNRGLLYRAEASAKRD